MTQVQAKRNEARSGASTRCWVVTDGRPGNENPALGLAEALARRAPLAVDVKSIDLAEPWLRLPPALWGDPFARLRAGSALKPPFDPPPDIWIGCGRLGATFAAAAKRARPALFAVQILRPAAPLAAFDLVIAPEHDRLAGDNVFSVIGAPGRVDPERMSADGRVLGASLGELPSPRVAVLIGGSNRAFTLGPARARKLAAELSALAAGGAGLMVTASRRTDRRVVGILKDALAARPHFFWDGGANTGFSNPYYGMLDLADHILVTEDSVNMAADAATTGKPVHILSLDRAPFGKGAAKFDRFHASLAARGATRRYDGALTRWSYTPLDEATRAADEIMRRFSTVRARLA